MKRSGESMKDAKSTGHYDVIESEELSDLIARVNARVAEGYVPLGGVLVLNRRNWEYHHGTGTEGHWEYAERYLQAVFKG